MRRSTIGVVASAAGGLELLRTDLVQPLLDRGFTVAVTLTPTAATWLNAIGEVTRLQQITMLPVRWTPRLPSEPQPHPEVDLYVAAPMSANSVAKLALGIADNQALTVLGENIATTPMIVFPRINAAHARQPAWPDHIARLSSCVHLVYGDEVWPLVEPRTAGAGRELPWQPILHLVDQLAPLRHESG